MLSQSCGRKMTRKTHYKEAMLALLYQRVYGLIDILHYSSSGGWVQVTKAEDSADEDAGRSKCNCWNEEAKQDAENTGKL